MSKRPRLSEFWTPERIAIYRAATRTATDWRTIAAQIPGASRDKIREIQRATPYRQKRGVSDKGVDPDEVRALAEAGKTRKEIAAAIERTPNWVRRYMDKHGIEAKGHRKPGATSARDAVPFRETARGNGSVWFPKCHPAQPITKLERAVDELRRHGAVVYAEATARRPKGTTRYTDKTLFRVGEAHNVSASTVLKLANGQK